MNAHPGRKKKVFWSTGGPKGVNMAAPEAQLCYSSPSHTEGTHTHAHTHTRLEQGLLQNGIDLCLWSLWGGFLIGPHTHVLIVTHMGRPSKTLKGLVFIFAALLIRQVQGAAMRGNAPLAMGGTGLSVGGGACPTVLDPSSTRCFSSFGLQISFQRGPPSSNPTKQIEFQSRSFFFSAKSIFGLHGAGCWSCNHYRWLLADPRSSSQI